MTLYQKTLYICHSSGKVGSWQIEVIGVDRNYAQMVVTATKVLGGKSVETRTDYTKGKNIGRSNETTAREQAVFDAESKVKKQMDKGYTEEKPADGERPTNSLGLAKPMLAQPMEKVKEVAWPVMAQPKLDGHRCMAVMQDGQVRMYSRQGKPIVLPHIQSHLQGLLNEGEHLDGELYCHGKTLQEISSMVKKPRQESAQLALHVYDMVQPVCYSERHGNLARKLLPTNHDAPVRLLETHRVDEPSRLNELHANYLSQGYEGTIVRQLGVPYEDGKRSNSLMKKKDFQDAEFKVVDILQGKPRFHENGTRLEVAIYVCETNDGKRFNVTAEGDMYRKHEVWCNRMKYLGKQLTVKFFNWTPDQVPFLPVALRIREDI